MDGIAVAERALAPGSRPLDAVVAHARATGCATVRPDVVGSNPGARRLYERRGFGATREFRVPVLGPLLGFGGSTTMVRRASGAVERLAWWGPFRPG